MARAVPVGMGRLPGLCFRLLDDLRGDVHPTCDAPLSAIFSCRSYWTAKLIQAF